MIAFATSALLWGSAIGCGLMAGVYFAFSTFVMTSLGRIAPQAGAAAMNAINVDIVRSPFMPLFLGTTLMALALVVIALFNRDQPGAMTALAGGVLYVFGMFAVTMAVNVPLNDALARPIRRPRKARRCGRATCTTGRCGITCARWRRWPRACFSSRGLRRGSTAVAPDTRYA